MATHVTCEACHNVPMYRTRDIYIYIYIYIYMEALDAGQKTKLSTVLVLVPLLKGASQTPQLQKLLEQPNSLELEF
jgi:hypothetical protein